MATWVGGERVRGTNRVRYQLVRGTKKREEGEGYLDRGRRGRKRP